MKILITGGLGFIGGHLVRHLIDNKHDVVVVDNLSTGNYSNIADNHPSPIVRIVDCRDYSFQEEIADYAPFDFVYHLASTVGVNRVLQNPSECIENNLQGFRAVLGLGVPGIFTSTSEVYGKNTEALREDSDIIFSDKPRWAYAASKLIDEWLALGSNWNVVRLFNVVGPRQSGSYGAVLPRFVSQALWDNPITIYGNGSQIRSFINVKDCVRILYSLMNKKFGVVNVGGNDSITIGELAYKVREILRPNSLISYVPYSAAYAEGFEECPARIPDLTKMHSLVGFQNYISLEDTIKEIAVNLKEAMPTGPASISTKSTDKRAGSVALHSGD